MKLPKIGFKKSSKSDAKDGYVVLDLSPSSLKTLSFEQIPDSKLSIKGISVTDVYKDSLRKEIVKNSVEECLSQSDLKVNDAILGLSGPDVFGFTLIAKVKRDNPNEKITEKEISNIYNQIREACYSQAKKRWSYWTAEDDVFEPLDLVVTSIGIDGQPVSEPIDSLGEYIKISVYCSYASKKYYQWVIKMIDDINFSSVTVTTTLYAQAKVLSEVSSNFVLVDIGKDYTDVAVVFGKNVIQSRSFEIGGSFFSQYLLDKTGGDFASANAKKEAYSFQTIHEESDDATSDYLYEAGKFWRSAFSTTLASMTGIKSLPQKIYLSGGGSELPLIQEILLEDTWRKAVPFADDIEVLNAKDDLLKKYIDDEINVLNGARMFVAGTLGVIKLELDKADEI